MSHHHGDAKFEGNIVSIRAVEDAIRATRKYTEGLKTMWTKHSIQGEEFPSKVFSKYYEVYPDVDISRMSLGEGFEWVTGYKRHIDVTFFYNYKNNEARVIVVDGARAVKELANAIPNFSEALARVIAGGNGNRIKV